MTVADDRRQMSSMIATNSYVCGPYRFTSYLPRLGTETDQPQWVASIDGQELSARYPSLDDAMIAAIGARRASSSGPVDG